MPATRDEPNTSQGSRSAVDALDALLSEVNLLSNRLRQGIVLSGHSLGAAEYKVLQLLEQHGPMSVPNIARQRNTTRQNIQVLVNRLTKAGIVQSSDNPAHRRSSLLHLSSAALELCSEARSREAKMLQRLASGLGTEELGASAALLRSIRLSLQQPSTSNHRIPHSPQAPSTVMPRTVDSVGTSRSPSEPPEEEIPVSLL